MTHRLLRTAALAILASLLASFSARAYSPETGVWWNPNEPGTGLILDLQDNFMVVSLFVGDTQGNPTWYTSTGFLTGERGNSLYEGRLDRFPGAQCIGCGFRPVTPQIGVGGPIRIVFDPDDSSLATLTIGGRTTLIERFRFYYKRPEDGQVSENLTRLLGEWSATLDYSAIEGPGVYRGDVLVFDDLLRDNLGDFLDGCRTFELLDGFCDVDLLPGDVRYATAEYDPSTGEHVIVVVNSPTTFAAYYLILGSEKFEGEFSVYDQGSDPGGFFQARGYRSASRTFVQDDFGPSSKSKSAFGPGLPLTVGESQESTSKVRSAEDRASLNAIRERLEAQLTARRAAQ